MISLKQDFGELANKLVDPLLKMGYEYTSPAVERSVLLRMGFSSIEAKAIVDGCIEHNLIAHGAGNVIYRLAKAQNSEIRPAGLALADGKLWDEAEKLFDGGNQLMSDYKLSPDKPIDVAEILKDLENYRPRRRGWTWRKPVENLHMGPFVYHDCTEPLKSSVPLPPAHYFENIDPQPAPVITTEIASGRFEDDIRRMRMAAHHGADHIMVIRTAGQSHFDGLIEGTPQGMGGVPITRKQVRAQRKALDMIEDEVGRPINYHSYVSGVAGPDIAVMFAEEGVNGVHQDPQYNVIYRNINMIRSFVDACESKKLIAWAGMAQIDGAHNANATAREAWKVMPELMVQHGINAIFSARVGINKKNICLSTVPPTATPAPCVYMDLPYAVALRDLFHEYRMRAQMNTKYIESSTREATVTHVLNMFISKLTSADIQSTITPDEGRNVPWHIYNIEACDTAKQTLVGLDGLMEMVELKDSGYLREKARELKERAILFMEEMLELGGYFNAVEEGFFVDSGIYPERNGDGIARKIDGGIGAGTIFKREADYMAPVTAHYGYNNVEQYQSRFCRQSLRTHRRLHA